MSPCMRSLVCREFTFYVTLTGQLHESRFFLLKEKFGGARGRGEEEDMLGEEDMPPFSPSTDMRVSAHLYICAAGCIFAPT